LDNFQLIDKDDNFSPFSFKSHFEYRKMLTAVFIIVQLYSFNFVVICVVSYIRETVLYLWQLFLYQFFNLLFILEF